MAPPSAAVAAGDPPPPGGWLSGLVSGAGRFLAAVLGPDSPDSGSGSSDPESSQSPPPTPRGARGSGDHGNIAHLASDGYQTGQEIVLKDTGEGLALVSKMDPKDAIMQLLLQETYSRSESETLIEIIQQRVMDSDHGVAEPAIVLPIAWQADRQEDPVAYSSVSPNICPTTSTVPDFSPQKQRSSPVERSCNLNTDGSELALKRSYSGTEDSLDESLSRRVRPKLNGLNISNKQGDVLMSRSAKPSFEESITNDPSAPRGIPEETIDLLKAIPLLGTDNLTFSDIVSDVHTINGISGLHGTPPAVTAQTCSTSYQADWDSHNPTLFYPYSSRDLTETIPIKVEPSKYPAPLEPDKMSLARQNHDTHNICDDSAGNTEVSPSSSTGMQLENSSENCQGVASRRRITPTKRWSPTNVYRRQNNNNTIRSENAPQQQGNLIPVGQEANLLRNEEKKPAGRQKKSRRSRKGRKQMKNKLRLLL